MIQLGDDTKIKMLTSSQRMKAPESKATSLNFCMPHYRAWIGAGQALVLLIVLTLFNVPVVLAEWDIATAWASSNPTGSADNVTFAYSTTTAGTLLACGFTWSTGGVTVSGVSDSANGAWTEAVTETGGAQDLAVYFFPDSAASGSAVTVTVSFSGSTAGRSMACGAYSGILSVSPLDQTAGQAQANPGTTTDIVTSGDTSAITEASELVLGVLIGNEEAITYTIGTNFTSRLNEDNPTGVTGHWLVEDRTLSAPSVAAATATVSTTTVDTATVVATFKITAAGTTSCVLDKGSIC